ncbi:spore germination protein [Metabacillus indicus]|uniref:spore germination protein n=1 Tax=Metabacillus indicus TaxID=246786 RepID=UPI0029FF6FE1|nr:spore germination protein [Metabacillus indicus]MDX8288638.1 spore germination protein [Metabacillus indicus]
MSIMVAPEKVPQSLQTGKLLICEKLGNSSDLKFKEIKNNGFTFLIVYISTIVESNQLEEFILPSLASFDEEKAEAPEETVEYLLDHVIALKDTRKITDMNDAVNELLFGNTVILIEGQSSCISAGTDKFPERSISNPKAQRTLKGPDIGFNEDISSNTALIRKVIRNPALRIESPEINSTTKICIIYMEGKADKEIIKELKEELSSIKMDVILDSNYLEETLQKSSNSIFPLTLSTDRPDVVCSEIMEGRIALIVDGTPFVVTLPTVFVQLFQSPDDYYFLTKKIMAKRLSRMLIYCFAILLPALYIAFTIYHPGLIPTNLLVGIVTQRELVPAPTVVETIVFYFLILIITESSLRLPQSVVFTVTVFAAIVLGQSAVEAYLVQPFTLVVLSASYIFSSIIPVYSLATVSQKLTVVFMFLASVLGFFGIIAGIMYYLLQLSSSRSFGVPYLAPFAPFKLEDQKDSAVRVPMYEQLNNKKIFTKEEKDQLKNE